jgi:hypothetical protein
MFVGDVPVGDTGYTMRFGMYAAARLQAELGRSLDAVMKALAPVEAKTAKAELAALQNDPEALLLFLTLIWAGLLKHHPKLSVSDVGELVETHGADIFSASIAEAMTAAAPSAEGKATAAEKPPKKKARASNRN